MQHLRWMLNAGQSVFQGASERRPRSANRCAVSNSAPAAGQGRHSGLFALLADCKTEAAAAALTPGTNGVVSLLPDGWTLSFPRPSGCQTRGAADCYAWRPSAADCNVCRWCFLAVPTGEAVKSWASKHPLLGVESHGRLVSTDSDVATQMCGWFVGLCQWLRSESKCFLLLLDQCNNFIISVWMSVR